MKMETWLEKYERKGEDLFKHLSNHHDDVKYTTQSRKSALEISKKILYSAVLVLTNQRFRVSAVHLEENFRPDDYRSAVEHQITLDHVLNSEDTNEDNDKILKRATIPLTAIKKEIISLDPHLEDEDYYLQDDQHDYLDGVLASGFKDEARNSGAFHQIDDTSIDYQENTDENVEFGAGEEDMVSSDVLPVLGKESLKTRRSARNTDQTPLTSNAKDVLVGQRRLLLTRFECFLCEKGPEYATDLQLMEHISSWHVTTGKDCQILSCIYCEKTFNLKRKVFCKSYLRELLVFYVAHLVNKHPRHFPLPDYIQTLACPSDGCKHVTYSILAMRKHLQFVHQITLTDKQVTETFGASLIGVTKRTSPMVGGRGKRKADSEENDTWQPPSKIKKKMRVKLRKKSPKSTPTKLNITTTDPESCRSHRPFSLLDDGMIELCTSPYADKPERQITLSSPQCFLCSDQMFETDHDLKEHWKTHWIFSPSHAIFKCQYSDCTTEYKMLKKKFLGCNISEVMAMYCQHLERIHNDYDKIPDYINRNPCPVAGCTKKFYQLLFVRTHLRSHGVEVDTGKLREGQYQIPSSENQAEFLRYCCFLCNDQKVHVSVMDFINHWVMEHIGKDSEGFVLNCPHCCAVNRVPGMDIDHASLSDFMWLVGWLLNHLAAKHEFEVPDYVSHVPGESELKTNTGSLCMGSTFETEEANSTRLFKTGRKRKLVVRRKHQLVRARIENGEDAEVYLTKYTNKGDRKITLRSRQCLLCVDSVVYSSDTDLCNHWVRVHTKRSQMYYTLQCAHCPHTWKLKRSRCIADVMEWMCFVCTHLQKHHSDAFILPDFVETMPCLLSQCNVKCFSENTMCQHLNGHDLKRYRNGSGPGSWTVIDQPSHASYSKFMCFVCQDDVDHLTLVDYINHWLDTHLKQFSANVVNAQQAHNYVIECSQCRRIFGISKRQLGRVSSVLETTSIYLLHLITDHGMPQPECVVRLPELKPQPEKKEEEEKAVGWFKAKTADIVMYKGMHERKIALKSYRCYVCEMDGWPAKDYCSERKLCQHWLDVHYQVSDKEGVLSCKFCPHMYKTKRHKLINCNILETMAFYILHLKRSHNFEVPAYIVCAQCPIFGCNFESYLLNSIRIHIKKHGFPDATHDHLRQGDLPLPVQREWVDFQQLRCFLCADDNSEFPSMLFLLNHWLQHHFDDLDHEADNKNACIKCTQPECDFQATLQGKLLLGKVWEKISILLFHMVESHSYSPPGYVVTRQCNVAECSGVFYSQETLEKHQIEVHNIGRAEDTDGFSGGIEGHRYTLQYKDLKCFECSDPVQHDSLEALAVHWQQNHLEKTDHHVKIKCKECEKTYVEKFVYAGHLPNNPRIIHEMLSRYLLHKVKKHAFKPPEFIYALKCTELACSFITFTPKALDIHVEKEHTYRESNSQAASQKVLAKKKAEEEEDDGTVYGRRPLDIFLKKHCCFLCSDGYDYGDRLTLTSHCLKDHCEPQDNGYILQCPHCWKRYSMTNKARNPKLIMEVIGSLLMHMAEKHNFLAPDYIEKVPCLKPDCTYFTYTTDRLASHLKIFHNIIDTRLGKYKSKNFRYEKKSGKNLTSKLIMKMRDYKCFGCSILSRPVVELGTHFEFAEHWRESHYTTTDSAFTMRCAYCDHGYKVPKLKGQEASGMLENISFYFMHLVSKHKLDPPDYVIPYPCEASDCDYVTFTLFSLENHCKSRHKMTHEALVKLIERDAVIQQAINPGIPPSANNQAVPEVPVESNPNMDQELAVYSYPTAFHQPPEAGMSTNVDVMYSNFMGYQLPMPPPSATQGVPRPTFMCFKCGKYFNTPEERKSHMDDAHNADPLNLCYICSKGFRTTDSFHEHMFKDHSIVKDGLQGLYCDQCDFSTVFSAKLARHMHRAHRTGSAGDLDGRRNR